ncbi:MAG TPA: hypothetical protein VM737_03305 [Gemmatimonadota bacterium]|nr:hypothetical protein [Gemmatimonadota bacterium]
MLWAVLLGVAAACGGPSPGDPGPAAEPPDEDRPRDVPLLDSGSVQLRESFRLEPGLRLQHPRDLALDGAASLYVLDFASPSQLFRYDSTGQFVGRFGDRDTEEERLASAIEFAIAPWNTVLIVDRGRNALHTFLTIGTFASSVQIEPGVGLDVHALPEFGEFYLHRWVPEQRRSTVLHMRIPYDSLAITYEVRIPAGLTVREEARAVHFHTAIDRRGQLLVAFWDGYPVRVLAPNGETVRTIDLDRRPVRKDPQQIAREAEENLALLVETSPGVDEDLLTEAAQPDSIFPLIQELVVDPQDRLWVRTSREDAAGVTPYDVFNEAGQYLARVDIPGQVERTAFGPAGDLYVIASTGDRREVIGYEVRFGESN